jgi:hypothetical protein
MRTAPCVRCTVTDAGLSDVLSGVGWQIADWISRANTDLLTAGQPMCAEVCQPTRALTSLPHSTHAKQPLAGAAPHPNPKLTALAVFVKLV